MDDTTSAIYGTLGYQAPEIAQTGPSIPSDLFTVGRTLAVLCPTSAGYQTTFAKRSPPPTTCRCSRVRLALPLPRRATAADPDDRFQSADEMAMQLDGVLREVVGG